MPMAHPRPPRDANTAAAQAIQTTCITTTFVAKTATPWQPPTWCENGQHFLLPVSRPLPDERHTENPFQRSEIKCARRLPKYWNRTTSRPRTPKNGNSLMQTGSRVRQAVLGLIMMQNRSPKYTALPSEDHPRAETPDGQRRDPAFARVVFIVSAIACVACVHLILNFGNSTPGSLPFSVTVGFEDHDHTPWKHHVKTSLDADALPNQEDLEPEAAGEPWWERGEVPSRTVSLGGSGIDHALERTGVLQKPSPPVAIGSHAWQSSLPQNEPLHNQPQTTPENSGNAPAGWASTADGTETKVGRWQNLEMGTHTGAHRLPGSNSQTRAAHGQKQQRARGQRQAQAQTQAYKKSATGQKQNKKHSGNRPGRKGSSTARTSLEHASVKVEETLLFGDPKPGSSRTHDVTFVTHASPEKVWILHRTCSRWMGHLSLSLLLGGTAQLPKDLETAVAGCTSATVVVVRCAGNDQYACERDYPVNMMRNLAVGKVQTSHYVMVDVDLVPSSGLRELILENSDQQLADPYSAIVVPAFEVQGKCRSLEQCQKLLFPFAQKVPLKKKDLQVCIQQGGCTPFQERQAPFGHGTTRADLWLDSFETRPIDCFLSNRYEPYTVLRKSNETPSYDERFTGFGRNKIQYTFHLRWLGFRFSVLPYGFLVHLPHPISEAKRDWDRKHHKGAGNMAHIVKEYVEFSLAIKKLPLLPNTKRTETCDPEMPMDQ